MAGGRYDFARIEAKWQETWDRLRLFEARDDFTRPKYYALIEFPYPSGSGLHVGHPRSNTALDIISRKRRMEGYNVLFPIGWDAFGLPTENYAVKHRVHPKRISEENVATFKRQLKKLGFSFDWRREVNTTDPAYYKWTQWIFLRFFEHGLAYKAEMPINWCPACRIGLANEEVVGGACERCGQAVHKRVKKQWMLRITDYAEKLLDGLGEVDFIERARLGQRNWIGRSEGAEIDFPIAGSPERLRVFTTRQDTVFGATYMVLAPEHPLLDTFRDRIANWDEVRSYRERAARKTDLERTELTREKTGVEIRGLRAINPATQAEIPLWISDYVLVSYGTGAIMAVPGHDTRDWEFARAFGLPIVEVIGGGDITREAYTETGEGVLVNSGFLNGLGVNEAIAEANAWLERTGSGRPKTNYKLRDWVFSRQRYWGEPIPLIECPSCGWVPVPEEDLPVTLPEIESYEPTQTGESPLAVVREWVETTCPRCGGPGRRETDTMPNWAGSSWYFIRYLDPRNDRALAAPEKMRYWLPVDWYNGGMEHTTLHLLYARFWHRFLHDIGVVPTREPFAKRTSHGVILGENHERMSKSRGNVINPDEIVDEFGADTFRVYEMFIGAFDQDIPWSTQGVKGCHRFLQRVWGLLDFVTAEESYSMRFEGAVHKTIKKVTADYENTKFNTAISALMSLVNDFYLAREVTRGELGTLLVLLYPVAPHISEELWEKAGFSGFVHEQRWAEWDEAKTLDEIVEVAVQVNGRLRDRMEVPAGTSEEGLGEAAVTLEKVRPHLEGKTVVKIITVPDRLVNIVVK